MKESPAPPPRHGLRGKREPHPGELGNLAAVVAHDRGEAGGRAHALVPAAAALVPAAAAALVPIAAAAPGRGIGLGAKMKGVVGWKMEKNGGIFSVVLQPPETSIWHAPARKNLG
jgi:hypothetical protein